MLRPRTRRWRLVVFATLCTVAFAASPAFRTIHVFSSAEDGNSPRAALVLAPAGTAYGDTLYGGSSNNGTVYQLTPEPGTEKWSESVIYDFAGPPDGANPAGTLVLTAGGTIYGTTIAGGSTNAGTVFQLTPPGVPGGAWTETVLYSFLGAPDGAAPHAGLVLSVSGVLYGTTANGGDTSGICTSGCGTVFSLTPPVTPGGAWTETVLHVFEGSDGANPFASLVAGPGSRLYGTTVNGGASGFGGVFSVTTAGATKVIYSFSGGTDGANPYAPLIVDANGNLDSAARNGGSSGMGTLFSLTNAGKITVLHSFAGTTDGANPVAGLLLANNKATLYGAASLGGANGDGTLFSLQLNSPTTTFKVLYTFDGVMQSANPLATPILALSGALLGTTEPSQVLDNVTPDTVEGGSAYSYCTKNPPACGN
jgi:uncharacterized repeat protein (TIGR03803 family)